MTELERLLRDIAPAEREEALQYYTDYFDDAGAENEQAVLEELGSPAGVAENIKKDLDIGGQNRIRIPQPSERAVIEYDAEWVSTKAEDTSGTANPTYASETTWDASGAMQEYRTSSLDVEQDQPGRGTRLPGWVIVLLVILGILATPIGIGLIGTLVGLLATWFALIVSFGAVAFSLLVVLVILLIVGIMCIAVSPWTGVALIGGGLLCGGVGLLFLMLTVAMAGIATPAACRGVASLFRRKSV